MSLQPAASHGAPGPNEAVNRARPNPWVTEEPSQTHPYLFLAPAPASRALLGVHHVAGASTWAKLLQLDEVNEPPVDGELLVVARTTLAGVEAAKLYTRRASAVLLVPDAPGRVPAEVRRAITVLAGAAPIIRAPWLSELRGALEVPDARRVRQAAAKVAADVNRHWKE